MGLIEDAQNFQAPLPEQSNSNNEGGSINWVTTLVLIAISAAFGAAIWQYSLNIKKDNKKE